jgi:regulation of enolase protein 1 (concanavalin A-like superfamily)
LKKHLYCFYVFVDLAHANVSSVVSNPHSDWAVAPYPLPAGQPLTIRLTYDRGPHGLIHLQYHNGTKWVVFREITGWIIEIGKEYEIGVMACSPGQSSFKVDFWDLVANDYSEIAFSLGEAQFWGALNPNLNPETFGPT